MRVLIVDDSAAVRARLALLVREVAGIELDEAASADEAIATLGARAADVVLLDLHMPGKSGLELLPKLKATPHPPVVAVLTSDPSEHHRRLCLAQGADFFFDKSKDFDRVLELLARHLSVEAHLSDKVPVDV